MSRRRIAALSALIILFTAASGQVAMADTQFSNRLSVIIAGPGAAAESEQGANLTRSVVGLLSTLGEGQLFAFIDAAVPTEVVGPAMAGGPDFREFREQVAIALARPRVGTTLDLVGALAESYNLLAIGAARPGSAVYLISGEMSATQLIRGSRRVSPILDLLEVNGWPVNSLILPGASGEARNFLGDMSAESHGEVLELTGLEGLKALSEHALGGSAIGALTEVSIGSVSPTEVLTSTFSVAPGTRAETVLFFREGPQGSLRLSNPSGFEASAGDRTRSEVVETPHAVIWKLIDPAPGRWSVEMRGIEGAISAWHYPANKYAPALESYGVVPLNEPPLLVASVTDGRERVVVDGVGVTARVTTPDGATVIQELNDEGRLGDSIAGDGFFSALMAPVSKEGEYKVELELAWPDFEHRVTAQSTFTAQAFPAIEVTPLRTEDLTPGEKTKIGSIFVHVQGQPYAVSREELTPVLVSNDDQLGLLEMTPRRLLEEGRAWLYDIYYTPAQEALDTVIFQLELDYAGRRYAYSSDSVVLSSVLPAPPPEPAAPPAPPAPALPPAPPEVEPSGLPWGLLAIPIALAAAAAAIAAFRATQTRPHGYLYDDRNERVADFGALRRHPLMSLIFKSAVRGKELGVPGLESVWFKFSRKAIGLRSQRATPTVRVNNEPLVGETTIEDRTYIGTHGRLFTFLLSPMGVQPEPGVGDD